MALAPCLLHRLSLSFITQHTQCLPQPATNTPSLVIHGYYLASGVYKSIGLIAQLTTPPNMGRELRADYYIMTTKPKHKGLAGTYSDGFIEVHLNNIYSLANLLDTIIHEEIHKVIAMVTKGRTSAKADHFIMGRMEFW